MKTRHLLAMVAAALLVGCQTAAPALTTKTLTYTCEGGRTAQATYPTDDTAVLTIDGQTHQLHVAVSADGARYVGDHWQWWTKGRHDAQLAPLKAGETFASARGVACHAP